MEIQLILGLLQAAATALSQPGVTGARAQTIAGMVSKGTQLASLATTSTTHFVAALQALTAQITAMHEQGKDDLNDEEQAGLDAAIAKAHAEIQSA